MNSFYSKEELKQIGLKKYGNNVLISKKCSIYNPNNIEIGDNVRIDDYCILSGNIKLQNNVHISAYCALYGKGGIVFEDYTGCSAKTVIYSATDDFSGEYMVGAVLPKNLTNVSEGKVIIKRYAQLGVNTVVMPGITIDEGAVTGAFTFVNKDLDKWTINIGIPCRKIKDRSQKMLNLLNKKEEIIENGTKKY